MKGSIIPTACVQNALLRGSNFERVNRITDAFGAIVGLELALSR